MAFDQHPNPKGRFQNRQDIRAFMMTGRFVVAISTDRRNTHICGHSQTSAGIVGGQRPTPQGRARQQAITQLSE
jgi:hypothetical protein